MVQNLQIFWRFLSHDILEDRNKMAVKVELETYFRKPQRAVILTIVEEKALGQNPPI